MIYSHEVQHMCVVKKGPNHGPAPIPEEGKWVRSKEDVYKRQPVYSNGNMNQDLSIH